jgi:hypothetical protein
MYQLAGILTLTMIIPLTAVSSIPITRKAYVDFVIRELDPDSLIGNPDRGQYGPRHALPSLALYSLTGEKRYGEAVKKALKAYDAWVKEEIGKQGAHFSWEGPYLCGFHVRELRKGGLLTEDDEKWIREMFIRLADNLNAWKPGDGLWRGSQHRSQGQAIARGLAAMWYPGCLKAEEWNEYFKTVWNDWWQYRDVGINDTGYFYGSFQRILCAADLMGLDEVFTDPDVQKFIWDRLLYEVTPDGAVVPYGAHGGWNSSVGDRIFALELASAHTKDGRYRWAAHRLMDYLMKHGSNLRNQHHIHATNIEAIALASVVCDDSVEPVQPDDASRVLYRKGVLRLTNAEVREKYPGYGGLDCNMDMSQEVMPHKVVLRSGWEPGDLFMLIEAFPRHDPLNPTAVLGLMRYGGAMAMMESEKFISRENAVRIQDLSGNATYMGKKEYQGTKELPTGYDGMEVTVKQFSDHKLASHVILNVTNYMGYEVEHEREVFFIKNRFAVVRDLTTFSDNFKCRMGPVWNTQHLDMHSNVSWLNTHFDRFYFQGANIYDNPRSDLLVYHLPKPDCRLEVEQRRELENAGLSTRYAWEGEVSPGFRVQFSHLLLPHPPETLPDSLAEGVKVKRDEMNLVLLQLQIGEDQIEWILLNPEGKEFTSPEPGSENTDPFTFSTDARALYLDVQDGEVSRVLAVDARFLSVNDEDLLRRDKRSDFERAE